MWRVSPPSLMYRSSKLPGMMVRRSKMTRIEDRPSGGRNKWEGKTRVVVCGLDEVGLRGGGEVEA